MSHLFNRAKAAGWPDSSARELGHAIPEGALSSITTSGGGKDLSGLSITTLEFLVAGGDQDAIAELDRRGGTGGDTITTDPATGKIIVRNAAGEILSVSNPVSTGGGGASAPAFSGTAAGIQLQAKLALEADIAADQRRLKQIEFQEGLVFQRERELLQMRIENSQRELVFSQIGAERRELIGQQGEARRQQVELAGRDPFKFVFSRRGMESPGPTQLDTFKADLAEFADRALPQANINAPLPELQGALTNLESLQAPTPGPFLAHGGVIEMERGTDGAFTQKQAFLVGENPDGTINKTTEVIIRGGGKVEVIPLAGGGSHGFTLPDPSSLTATPSETRLARGAPGIPQLPAFRESFNPFEFRFGARPRRFARFFGLPQTEGALDFLDPFAHLGLNTGRRAASFALGGGVTNDLFNPENIALGQLLRQPLLRRFSEDGLFGGLSELPFSEFMASQRSAFGVRPEDTSPRENIFGTAPAFQARGDFVSTPESKAAGLGFLPSPFKIASIWNQLEPTEQMLALSAYDLSGIPPQSVLAEIEAATPQGRSFRPQRIGFTGTQF